ncbi:AtpZ/AtpI family protein [Paenibacillus pasadenensis]|uniref:AtpZ/AtpI family protein n=1 Tax=Paenibacillus pasadenensis TaxID=217090 RepID=UPI00203D4943|nr:AtpZ/AtpI family protein [Paenibacillus pasadenensis]MCM3747605.1 AtpZ/AtpI family protein [Paenibacillus pasadenensis]
MTKQSKGDNPLKALAFVGVLGIDVAICTLIGYWLGATFGETPGWIIAGVLTGLAAGIVSVVFIVKKVLGDSNE